MTTRNWFVVLLLSIMTFSGLRAQAASLSPGAAFMHARQLLQRPPLAASALSDAQQNPAAYRNKIFEVSANVGGVVSAGDERTALLTIGDLSITAKLPAALKSVDWIDSGRTVRALVLVDPKGNDVSLTNMSILAAAPEFEVAYLERRQARRPSYPSRSLAYSDQKRGMESVETASLPHGAAPVAPLSQRALAIYAPYWRTIRGLNRHLSNQDVNKITTSILYFSDHYNLDPRLVVAMIIAESSFNVDSTSRTGAMGLGQLMPSTAAGLGVTNAYDPVQNIAASVHILRGNLDKYGGAPADAGLIPFDQIALTMAAYNAGSGAVKKYHGVPPYKETKRYVAKVTALYKKMCGINK